MAARQKLVFTDISDIAHKWAHQTQGEARNPRNNFYFYGRTIYSYRNSFPIAEIIHMPTDIGTVCLFTTHTYSVTTATHIGATRRAIPSSFKVFNVPEFFEYPKKTDKKWDKDRRFKSHQVNITYYLRKIEDDAKLQAKAKTRNYWNRNTWGGGIMAYIDTIRDYADYWKCPKAVEKEWKYLLDPMLTEAQLQEKILGKAVDFFAKEKERKKKLSEKAQVFFNEWLEGQHDKGAINRNNFQEVLGGYVMLRCVYSSPDKTATVEPVKVFQTSLGVEVTYEEGLKLFHLIKKVRERKKPFPSGDANYGRVHIGNYAIDRIDENGNVTAGCHKIKWAEIERLTTKEGIV